MPLIWILEPRLAPRKNKCLHRHLIILDHGSHSPCWGDWGIEQVAGLARVLAGMDMLSSRKRKVSRTALEMDQQSGPRLFLLAYITSN